MPKGMGETAEIATGAVKLREMIRELEIGAANIKGLGEGTLHLLQLRDQAAEESARLAESMDLRPERTRIETIDGILTRKTSVIVHELRTMGGLAGARRQVNPPQEHWWWFLDQFQAEKQRKFAIRAILTVVGVAVLLVVVDMVMNRFFGMSPEEKQAHSLVSDADQYVQRGEYDKAIAKYEAAVGVVPSLGEAHVVLGVLYELKGEKDKAQAAFAAGEAAFPNWADYLLALSRAYQSVGKADEALIAVQRAIDFSPGSAYAYLVRGGIYEAQGKVAEALNDYEKASNLAQTQGQDTIYVLAKTRFATLLQSAGTRIQ
jgi:tetratricopeptide (TPR) repeat protein